MFVIGPDLAEDMIEHCRADHPIEACGYLVGPAGSGRPERLVRMTNAAAATDWFAFDSRELLGLYREMERLGEEPVAIYHSHTASAAYPSRSDREAAGEPDAHYVIVGTGGPQVDVRAYRIVGGEVSEEPVRITPPSTPVP